MLIETTVNKLHEMRLSTMARAFKEQLSDPNMASMSFEDRFGLLVDHEWATRKSNHLRKLVKQARFSAPEACVEDIEYFSERNLDAAQISSLATCSFITEAHNVILLGATCSGKTYISVSDIVALQVAGVVSCHYVDSIGFAELPDFIRRENYLKNAEMMLEDDYGMLDGIVNNGPKQELPKERPSILEQLKQPHPPERAAQPPKIKAERDER